jgi:hypothetical protein
LGIAAARPAASRAPWAPRPGGDGVTNTPDGVGSAGVWPGVVPDGPEWDIARTGFSGLAAHEVDLMQLELDNRTIIVRLSAAVAQGGAAGPIGRLDVKGVETGALEWAIEYAQRIGVVTVEAQRMMATAHVVRNVRLAMLGGDWDALEEALRGASGKVLAEIGAAEIRAAQDEVDNRAIIRELAGGMARGRAQGRTGRMFTGSSRPQAHEVRGGWGGGEGSLGFFPLHHLSQPFTP